MRLPMQEQRI